VSYEWDEDRVVGALVLFSSLRMLVQTATSSSSSAADCRTVRLFLCERPVERTRESISVDARNDRSAEGMKPATPCTSGACHRPSPSVAALRCRCARSLDALLGCGPAVRSGNGRRIQACPARVAHRPDGAAAARVNVASLLLLRTPRHPSGALFIQYLRPLTPHVEGRPAVGAIRQCGSNS
jgi:hypothetical protein